MRLFYAPVRNHAARTNTEKSIALMTGTPFRCIYLGDHPHLLPALIHLYRLEDQIQLLACASNISEALEYTRSQAPHAFLVDFSSRDLWALQAIRPLQQAAPQAVSLVMAAFSDQAARRIATSWGSDALLPQDRLGEKLAPCLETLLCKKQLQGEEQQQ